MAKYVVIKKFKDDDGQIYNPGEFYIREERAEALSTKNNKVGEVFIVKVVEPKEEKQDEEPKKKKESKKAGDSKKK